MTAVLCACGCGQSTLPARYTHRARGWIVGQPLRFVHGHNTRGMKRTMPSGDGNPNWKGGKRETHGYTALRQGIGQKATYKPEHVLIVEDVIGHPLPTGAIVHHVDENRANNANGNLVPLQSRRDHNELHRKLRVKRAGGNPWTDRICCDCHQAKSITQFYVTDSARRGRIFESRCIDCSKAAAAQQVAS